MNYYLAVDIGASSGRHILGYMQDGRMCYEEIYRFENGPAKKDGHGLKGMQTNRQNYCDNGN